MRILITICFLTLGYMGISQQIDTVGKANKENKRKSPTISEDSLRKNRINAIRAFAPDELKADLENKKFVEVPYEPKSDDFLDIYMEIVFGQSLFPDSLNGNRMRFWKEPVKVFIDPSVPKEDGAALKQFASMLDEKVDSLSIQFVNLREDSNYHVYYVNNEFTTEYEPRLSRVSNSYYIYWKGYKINRGFLKINTWEIDDPKVVQKLMQWHFFCSLGYFQKQKNLPCSDYLSNCFTVDKELSSLDLEVLKYHYSYGICKGTRITEFKENHREAKRTLARNPRARHSFIHFIE